MSCLPFWLVCMTFVYSRAQSGCSWSKDWKQTHDAAIVPISAYEKQVCLRSSCIYLPLWKLNINPFVQRMEPTTRRCCLRWLGRKVFPMSSSTRHMSVAVTKQCRWGTKTFFHVFFFFFLWWEISTATHPLECWLKNSRVKFLVNGWKKLADLSVMQPEPYFSDGVKCFKLFCIARLT